MSDKSDSNREGDIFDDVESFESDGKDPTLAANILDRNDVMLRIDKPDMKKEEIIVGPKNTVVVMSHLVVKHPPQPPSPPTHLQNQHHNPLPIMQGNHSIAHDMKFGWKPEVAFESAPIPLYFNFVDQALLNYYEGQAYYQNVNGIIQQSGQYFKIIYYGPRFKDTFEMHKNFVKPSESTYDFVFPKFYGLASAKAFYDSFFAEEQGILDENGNGVGDQPCRDDMREFAGMAPDVEWDEMYFNSNFENGNLDVVVRTGENTYDLFLRADTNTRGHFGWFHFEVGRTRRGRTVHFNIVNMSKIDSLYNHGMMINFWSQKRNQPQFVGWERGGHNIKYGPSRMVKESFKSRKRYYTLSFSFTFDYDEDKVWFAYTIPYTYSMLTQYIKAISQEQRISLEQERQARYQYEKEMASAGFDAYSTIPPKLKRGRGKYLQESILCKSLGGVEVPLLTITNFDDPDWQKSKKIVFVQGRLHPGETAASWIIHGLISFLISKSRVANQLRKRVVFKIVPMCNPDGVIIGNTRTTLIGKDMNRQFPQVNIQGNGIINLSVENSDLPQVEEAKLNPIPFAIRELLNTLSKQEATPSSLQIEKLHSFWDIHQHSKKKSIFIYGPYYPLHSDKYLKTRIIPKLLSERSELFRYYSCRFRQENKSNYYKENCARLTIGKQFNISNCFTLECSSYGYISIQQAPQQKQLTRQTLQFREADLIEFGKSMAECILEHLLVVERDERVKLGIMERMRSRRSRLTPAIRPQTAKPTIEEIKSSSALVVSDDEGETSGDDDDSNDDGEDESAPDSEDEEIVLEEGREKDIDEEEEDDTGAPQNEIVIEEVKTFHPEQSPKMNISPHVIDSEEDDEDEDESEEVEKDDPEYKQSPVMKPTDIKGLMKIKQKKSKLDLKIYSSPPPQSPKSPQNNSQTISFKESNNNSPISSPSNINKPKTTTVLLKNSAKKKSQSIKQQARTLNQLLNMIETDIIQEENNENSEESSDDDDDKGNEDDFLCAQDQRVLRDRVLHAIEVFSRWTPNPRKEILKHRRAFKLSIEHRSRASSKKSERSFSDDMQKLKSSPRKLRQQLPNSTNIIINKQQQMDIIDKFLKEFGLNNPSGNKQTQSGGGLSLVGSKIANSNLEDLDDDVLSTISNEILRFKSNKKLKKSPQENISPIKLLSTPTQGNWHLSSETNKMLIEQQLHSIMSLKLDHKARKIILQKFFQQHPNAALDHFSLLQQNSFASFRGGGQSIESVGSQRSNQQDELQQKQPKVTVISKKAPKKISEQIFTSPSNLIKYQQQENNTANYAEHHKLRLPSRDLDFSYRVQLLQSKIQAKKNQAAAKTTIAMAEFKNFQNAVLSHKRKESLIHDIKPNDFVSTIHSVHGKSPSPSKKKMSICSTPKPLYYQEIPPLKVQSKFEFDFPPLQVKAAHPEERSPEKLEIRRSLMRYSSSNHNQISTKGINAATDTNLNALLSPKSNSSPHQILTPRSSHSSQCERLNKHHSRQMAQNKISHSGGRNHSSENASKQSILSDTAKQSQLKLNHIKEQYIQDSTTPKLDHPILSLPLFEETSNYNPFVGDGDRAHQISIFQWTKMHRKPPQDIMIQNRIESQLNLTLLQTKQNSIRSTKRQQKLINSNKHQQIKRPSSSMNISKSSVVVKDYLNASIGGRTQSTMLQSDSIHTYNQPPSIAENVVYNTGHNSNLNRDIIFSTPMPKSQVPTPPAAFVKHARSSSQVSEIRLYPSSVKGKLHQKLDLTISNAHQPQQTRFTAFRDLQRNIALASPALVEKRNQMMEYLEKNKSLIVRDIMLKSGEEKLSRPSTAMIAREKVMLNVNINTSQGRIKKQQ